MFSLSPAFFKYYWQDSVKGRFLKSGIGNHKKKVGARKNTVRIQLLTTYYDFISIRTCYNSILSLWNSSASTRMVIRCLPGSFLGSG